MRCCTLALAALIAGGGSSPAAAQGTAADRVRSGQYSPANVARLVFNASVTPGWIGATDRFWYVRTSREGKTIVLVDPSTASAEPAFDHGRLSTGLASASGETVNARALPLDTFSLVDGGTAVAFRALKRHWRCQLATYACRPDAAAERLAERAPATISAVSPNRRWAAFVRDFNLWVRQLDTGEETQLTRDGVAEYHYGSAARAAAFVYREMGLAEGQVPVVASWSPDSTRIVVQRVDERRAYRFHLVESAPKGGAPGFGHYSYAYALPGRADVTVAELVAIDVPTARQTTLRLASKPVLLTTAAPPVAGERWWTPDSRQVCFVVRERRYQRVSLACSDVSTGDTRTVVDERSATWVDVGQDSGSPQVRLLDGGRKVLWWSQRDGWAHLYLYDVATGRVLNQVTHGEWAVREIARVDETARVVFFTAGGREPGRNLYYRHLYRVNLDGTGLRLLTPENCDHDVQFSPSGRWFVDRMGRMDAAPSSALRQSDDGAVRMVVERADFDGLLRTGWRWPEPFTAMGRDGKTRIHGLIVRPSTFDPSRRYPVIDNIYAGPQRLQTPVSLACTAYWSNSTTLWSMQALAEYGFIVVAMDGMGTPFRSKAFHDVAFRNLGDAGLPDHVAVLRELAQRDPSIDLTRVGVYGHSAGGYASTRAMLAYPDFFKVAVSSAGNHDHRLDKASWIERYMGQSVGPHYAEQANATSAERLQGKLLLAHGELDDNVHPAATINLAAALVAADKDFDLLIMPGRRHAITDEPYFVRRRAEFFITHLLESPPPQARRQVK